MSEHYAVKTDGQTFYAVTNDWEGASVDTFETLKEAIAFAKDEAQEHCDGSDPADGFPIFEIKAIAIASARKSVTVQSIRAKDTKQ